MWAFRSWERQNKTRPPLKIQPLTNLHKLLKRKNSLKKKVGSFCPASGHTLTDIETFFEAPTRPRTTFVTTPNGSTSSCWTNDKVGCRRYINMKSGKLTTCHSPRPYSFLSTYLPKILTIEGPLPYDLYVHSHSCEKKLRILF